MKVKHFLVLSLLAVFLAGIFSSCMDPRRNCNHPDHGRYMQERINKRRGVKF